MIERGEAPSFRYGHDQGGNEIECGDRNDQHKNDEHHFLFGLDGGEPVAVLFRPVAHDDIVVGKQQAQFMRYLRSFMHVFDLNA